MPRTLSGGDQRVLKNRDTVPDVEADARGIITPPVALRHIRLDRAVPAPDVARIVDRYWLVSWDLPPDQPYTQRVWPHPVVNLVLEDEGARAGGVARRMFVRTLTGRGAALGVMFRPAGFAALIDVPMADLDEASRPIGEIVPALGGRLERAIGGVVGRDIGELAAAADEVLSQVVPADTAEVEDTAALVEQVAADPGITRVDQIADLAGCGPRQLQRRFARLVGLSPKHVVRRYRIFEAAERARAVEPVDWAVLAVELGYADQAHLTRDFRDAIGLPPATYARLCATAGDV